MEIPNSSIIGHYIIDMSSNNNFVQVPTVQGDGQNTRYMEVELISNHVPYFDSLKLDGIDNFIIAIMGTKPDTKQIFDYCSVSDEGYLMVPITYQMTAVPGIGEYQIAFFNKESNNQLKSFPFYVVTNPAAYDIDQILSSNEFYVLSKNVVKSETLVIEQEKLIAKQTEQTSSWDNTYQPAIIEATNNANTATVNANTATSDAIAATENANEIIQSMSELETSVSEAENLRVASEEERKQKETDRETAETKRIENAKSQAEAAANQAKVFDEWSAKETERETAEAERIKKENQRIADEELRSTAETERQTKSAEAVSNAESATVRANTAAERAEKIVDDISTSIGIDDTNIGLSTAWSSAHTEEMINQAVENSKNDFCPYAISGFTISPNDWVGNKIYVLSDSIKENSVIDVYYNSSSFDTVSDMNITLTYQVGWICFKCQRTTGKNVVVDAILIKNYYNPAQSTIAGVLGGE